jgi:hypothetical protein
MIEYSHCVALALLPPRGAPTDPTAWQFQNYFFFILIHIMHIKKKENMELIPLPKSLTTIDDSYLTVDDRK